MDTQLATEDKVRDLIIKSFKIVLTYSRDYSRLKF